MITKSWQMTDLTSYPVCIGDEDCKKQTMQTKQDHVCFQFFCYPWKTQSVTAGAKKPPLELCRKTSDCRKGQSIYDVRKI